MTEVTFVRSEPLTLGIEEEFFLLDDGDGETAPPRADELLDAGWDTVASPGGWFKAELLRCSLELTTAASGRLLQLDVDLRALREAAIGRAADLGMRLAGVGMHPSLVATEALVSPTQAHRDIAGLHARVGTLGEQVTHGIHVHVGVPGLADAVRVANALAACVPTFIAATANSPVVRSARSPWRSARSDVLRRMLWAGPTPRFAGVGEYRAIHALHQLENTGEQRFLWEVAPVPALGTVEVRAFDAHADPAVALGAAALVQGLAAHVLDGGDVARANESIERHNRWSAMEFGPRARFLVSGRDEPVDAAELVRDAVELARPYARTLGSERWLDVFERLLADPPADRLIATFDEGGVRGVLDACTLR